MELLVRYVFILSQIMCILIDCMHVSHFFFLSYSCDFGGLHFIKMFSLFIQISTLLIFDCPLDILYRPTENNC